MRVRWIATGGLEGWASCWPSSVPLWRSWARRSRLRLPGGGPTHKPWVVGDGHRYYAGGGVAPVVRVRSHSPGDLLGTGGIWGVRGCWPHLVGARIRTRVETTGDPAQKSDTGDAWLALARV